MLKLVIVVARQSWKNDARVIENHGKIMEFDSRKALGTLFLLEASQLKMTQVSRWSHLQAAGGMDSLETPHSWHRTIYYICNMMLHQMKLLSCCFIFQLTMLGRTHRWKVSKYAKQVEEPSKCSNLNFLGIKQ